MSGLVDAASWYYRNNNLARIGMNAAAGAAGRGVIRALPHAARFGWRVSPARAMYRAGAYLANRYTRRTGGIVPAAVRAQQGGPLNRIDAYYTAAPIGTTIVFTLLNGTIPGDNVTNRTGRQITNSSLNIKLVVQPVATLATLTTYQMAIVYDKQSNGAVPSWGDIWSMSDNSAPTLNNTAYMCMGRNPSNIDRFDVIHNGMYHCRGGSTNVGNEDARQTLQKYIKLKNRITRYNSGVTGTITDIQTGALWCVFFGDLVSGSCAAVSGVIQLNFAP